MGNGDGRIKIRVMVVSRQEAVGQKQASGLANPQGLPTMVPATLVRATVQPFTPRPDAQFQLVVETAEDEVSKLFPLHRTFDMILQPVADDA